MCRACLDSPSVKRALAARQLVARGAVRAQPRPTTASRRARRRSTNGRVDLVYRDGDELVVVDYKTDKDVTKETAEQYALEHHAGQGEVYAQGSRHATGLKVREVAFVYCKAGAEVRLRRGDGEELVARVVTGEAEGSIGGG